MSSAKPLRPRTVRRELARLDEKHAEAREKLFLLEPGGRPERPIEVISASLVEPRTRSMPCPRCNGELRVEDHTAETFEGDLQRVVAAKCYHCGKRRRLFFRVTSSLPS